MVLNKIKNAGRNLTERAKMATIGADEYIVALDVGTEYVKALIGRINNGGAEIVGVGRAHQSLADMQAGAVSDIGAVVENCNQALAVAEEQAGVSVRSAVVGIAGELVKGTTISVRVTRKDPSIELDVSEMEQIITLVQQRAAETARKNLAWELGGKQVEVRLVNSALVSISIDGYEVTNPIGFKGRDVMIQLYTAFAPMIHISALERVASELDLELIAVAAEPFAVSRSVIGDNPNANLSAILMDVGGGTTDIAVINEGGVQGTKMFGIGGRAFSKAIERDLSVDYETAEKLKIEYSNHQEVDRQQAVGESLDKACDVWLAGVEVALSEFNNLENLPHQVLLCGGGASLDKLVAALQETNWYSQLQFARKPHVSLIDPNQVIGISDKTGKITDHTFITALGLMRVGLDTQFQQNSPDNASGIRSKFDKILQT